MTRPGNEVGRSLAEPALRGRCLRIAPPFYTPNDYLGHRTAVAAKD